MQMAVPEAISFKEEAEETKQALRSRQRDDTNRSDRSASRHAGCPSAACGSFRSITAAAATRWDAHKDLKKNHGELSAKVDKPIAGLLKDLKQRGLLDETIVVLATEFGRTPGAENSNGRDHHPFGFSVWMAGGGIKAGVVHGKTDEIGFHAVENRHYVTDVHATVLHQLGIDPKRLDVPGRKRLEIDYGKPIREIIA